MINVTENAKRILQEVEALSHGSVTLVAVSKFKPAEDIQAAKDAGILHFGENRAQEFREKVPRFPDAHWHFIGQLQLNKVKYVVGKACLIQSVDRIELVREIDRLAQSHKIVQDLLIEVGLDDDPARGGVSLADLPALVEETMALPAVNLKGFMCVAPLNVPCEQSFERMRTLYESYRIQIPQIDTLSMGMSHDYVQAIAQGATMVRVGSSIFGSRPIQG